MGAEGVSRYEEARRVAAQLLEELEGGQSASTAYLMKAKRLARLLRDEDAQLWLDLELRGYPKEFDVDRLGTCLKYAVTANRVRGKKYYTDSIPTFEAKAHSAKAGLGPIAIGDNSLAVDDYIAAGATQRVLDSLAARANSITTTYATMSGLVASMLSGLYSYVADTSLALEFGDAAETVFERARVDVDAFVRSRCPSAVQPLLAMNERMQVEDGESLSSALNACRRLLSAVADSVFPPQEDDYVDKSGKARRVGPDDYKNRLLAYYEQSVKSDSTLTILSSDLEHIAARLDSLNDKACKGVHRQVDAAEARLTVIGVYLLVAEVARVADEG